MLFLSDILKTSSAEFYDAVCIAHTLGYNTALKRMYFQELSGILEKSSYRLIIKRYKQTTYRSKRCGSLD